MIAAGIVGFSTKMAVRVQTLYSTSVVCAHDYFTNTLLESFVIDKLYSQHARALCGWSAAAYIKRTNIIMAKHKLQATRARANSLKGELCEEVRRRKVVSLFMLFGRSYMNRLHL